jgi:hypothetical protein
VLFLIKIFDANDLYQQQQLAIRDKTTYYSDKQNANNFDKPRTSARCTVQLGQGKKHN